MRNNLAPLHCVYCVTFTLRRCKRDDHCGDGMQPGPETARPPIAPGAQREV
jgi:hypothetical protein